MSLSEEPRDGEMILESLGEPMSSQGSIEQTGRGSESQRGK